MTDHGGNKSTAPNLSSEPKLEFKPLHVGLGFHPFSDGLPYASTVKSPQRPKTKAEASLESLPPTPMGTGAMAAGMPRPVVTPLKASSVVEPAPKVGTLTHATDTSPLLHLFKKTLAYMIDFGLHISLCAVFLGLAIWKTGIPLSKLLNSESILVTSLFCLGFHWALTAAEEVAFHTTLGKRLFDIYIEGSASQIFLRALYFPLSVLPLGMGLIWALFEPNHRTWHDLFTETHTTEYASL